MTRPCAVDRPGDPGQTGKPLLVPVLSGGYRRAEYLFGAAVWAATLIYFWAWWLEPRHHDSVLAVSS